MTIPEFILLDTFQKSINFLRFDLQNANENTFLYKLFNTTSLQTYNFYEQLKSILARGVDEKRFLTIELMYNSEREEPPSIYISQPSEQQSSDNAIGMGDDSQNYKLNADGSTTIELNRRYSATYDIVVSSDNSLEVVALYHLLKSLTVVLVPYLHSQGLQNIKISGQDLTQYSEIVPKAFYVKALRLQLDYSTLVPEQTSQQSLKNFLFTGKIVGI